MIIYLILIEIDLIFRLKLNYLNEYFSLINLSIIICSLLGVAISIWRWKEYNRIKKIFENTHGYIYLNFQSSIYINNILRYIYGFSSFFGTIKLIHLCRFNQHLYSFMKIFKYILKELISFSLFYFSLICLCYFLFPSNVSSYSTLFKMTLIKFDFHQFNQIGGFLGTLCLSLCIILIVFVYSNMILSILNQSFRQAKQNLNKQNEEIFAFTYRRLLCWIGKSKFY